MWQWFWKNIGIGRYGNSKQNIEHLEKVQYIKFMNSRENYQSLADKYKSGVQLVKKLGTYGMILQVSTILVINSWKHLQIDYYMIAAPILFSLSIYFFVKDFFTLRRIEENMAQMILDGVELETKNAPLGKFFHGLLQSFNFTSILIQRSLINALALGCLGYLIFQFISDVIFPDVTISRLYLSLFVWIPSVSACKLYYDSLKVLDEAKDKVFAK